MRTLGGRIGLALLVFGLVTLVAVGGALWVVLRDLHRDAALGTLAELTVPYTAQARQRILPALLLPSGDGDAAPGVGDGLRERRLGRPASEELLTFVEETQAEIDAAGISLVIVTENATFVRDPETGVVGRSGTALEIPVPALRGTVSTGTLRLPGRGPALFASTPIREARRDRAVPTLALLREDDSARQATADLVRSLSLAGILLVVIGVPMAAGLSRSVTRPLRRLSAATATVARGKVPDPLPTSGPTEVAEASAAFNAMAAEVEATRDAQRQLLADIRHDLRTPLTVISGFAEALRDGTATGAVAERAADAIGDEAARLERMLDDLDHLSVPGVGGPPLRLETIDALEVARGTVERFAAEAEARGQSLRLADDAVGATFAADRDALDRILGNIIANALAHAPSPGGQVTLEVSTSGALITLAVRDDGPGIPRAALARVFDRFYRADPSRASQGTGLGLAIVRDLAEALGGEAFAESPPAGGARVGVHLPAIRSAPPAPSA